jgi:opacity protein-like surface antigen
MKSSILKKAAISTLLLLSLSAAHAGDWSGNVSGYLGHKSLDDKDWPQLDSQFAIGVLFDIKKQDWPVSIALDIIGSGDVHEDGSQKDEGLTGEYHLGVRKIFELPNYSIKPYLGGGIAFVHAKIKDKDGSTTRSEDDDAIGGWIGGGMYVGLTPHFNLGLDVRYSKAEVTLFDKDREAGGMLAGVTAGYHW